MAERPEDRIAARQRQAEAEELAQLRQSAEEYVAVIQKVIPFAVENIKRHDYPSDPGLMGKPINLIMMWLGSGPKHPAWGSRNFEFAIDAEGTLYSYKSKQTSAGSSSWWEPQARMSVTMPADVREAKNYLSSLAKKLWVLDNIATKLMSTAGTHHKSGYNPECIECKLAREYRTPLEQIPPGYPTQEVDALMSPDKPRVKSKTQGFWAQLRGLFE